MKKRIIWTFLSAYLMALPLPGQSDPFQRISFILGRWEGTGEGFGNDRSVIQSSFQPVMDGKYIEVTNDSRFEPTGSNPEGEHHTDRGFISYDVERDVIVYRQFNNEGYQNRYILNDTLSFDSLLVFETESIENFIPGGKARYTIRKISETSMETVFDVSFPGSGYTCFGTNHLRKTPAQYLQNGKPGITGIGGIFFRSEDPGQLRQWYRDHLGLVIDDYGAVFEFRSSDYPDQINYLRWSPFERDTEYLSPSEKGFMINYRVRNLEEMVANLEQKGIVSLDRIETYDYGKFVHITDPEGNKIELWEPVDDYFTRMGGVTNK